MDTLRSIFCLRAPSEDTTTPRPPPKLTHFLSSTSSMQSAGPHLMPTIKTATMADLTPLVNCLAAAFLNDPVDSYFLHCPDNLDWTLTERWNAHVAFITTQVKLHLHCGLVLAIGQPAKCAFDKAFRPLDPKNPSGEEAYDCVALIMPPGKTYSWFAEWRSGCTNMSRVLSREGTTRFEDEFTTLLMDTKKEILSTDDWKVWYLVWLGTRPGGRGKGHGKAVLRYMTDIADENGTRCYLESSSERNLNLYRRAGFETVKRIELKRAVEKVGLSAMLREPVGRLLGIDEKCGTT